MNPTVEELANALSAFKDELYGGVTVAYFNNLSTKTLPGHEEARIEVMSSLPLFDQFQAWWMLDHIEKQRQVHNNDRLRKLFSWPEVTVEDEEECDHLKITISDEFTTGRSRLFCINCLEIEFIEQQEECDHEWRTFRGVNGPYEKCTSCGKSSERKD